MSNFDDLFANANTKETNEKKEPKTEKSFNKEEWIEKKKAERASAFSLLKTATESAVEDPEKFRDYLNAQSRFDRYSVSNALLIAEQYPEATSLADFNTWKDRDVLITKGASSIVLLEPGSEYVREDGSTGFSVNVKKVFDISQTSNANKSERGKTFDSRVCIKALITASTCDIRMTNDLPDGVMAQYNDKDNTIDIRQGMEGNDIFCNLAYFISIARLSETELPNNKVQFAAYCSTYILCERYGFDTGDFNFDAIKKEFEGVEPKEVRSRLDKVRNAANEISQDMNREIEAKEKANRSRDEAR